jgi:hypothetical protein
MDPFQWFLAGGIWMWPILLMFVVGLPIAILALLLQSAKTNRMRVLRNAAGVALLVVAATCLAAGAVGHLQAKRMLQAHATENGITDPDFLTVGNREARVPLEASIPPVLGFAIVGVIALRKGTRTDQ